MLAGIAQALAQYYGYKTITSLIGENFGLIIVLVAFIFVALVFYRLLNRQFPKSQACKETRIFRIAYSTLLKRST